MENLFGGLMFFLLISCMAPLIHAQNCVEEYRKGKALYQKGEYYQAYLHFNAAHELGKSTGDKQYAEKAAQEREGVVHEMGKQLMHFDSLLQATRKLTDIVYFYDNRLALAYKNGTYGYINKKGETIIPYQYGIASNFDEETGYAKIIVCQQKYWLAPNGIMHKSRME